MPIGDLAVVERWQTAANDADTVALRALSAADVEIVGPRGIASGADELVAWLGRARAHLEDRRWFCGGDGTVLVEHKATWHDGAGRRLGSQTIWSAFDVRDGVVTRYARYDAVETAFRATGIGARDEVVRV